jgi:hypothetical protein
MKRAVIVVACVILTWTVTAEDFEIESFHRNGELEFNQVQNAVSYRVEWSSSLLEDWQAFSALAVLDNIVPTGEENVIVKVPMFFRVVANVAPPEMVLAEGGSFVM